MRRLCLGIAGIVLAFPLGGCGDSSEEGPVTYKGTDSPAIQEMLKNQSKNMQTGAATTKAAEVKSTGKKDADKKPSDDPAADKKK